MTVPVMVHGRVVCVFSLALLCVSVSATAAEAAGPVEAAKPALKEINTAHAMAGEAVKRTTEFIELLKRANGTILEALKLSQNTLKTAESSVKNPPARKELDAATEGTFKAESQKAATKAKKAAEEVANAVQYVYTAHVVAQWAKGNATKAAGLVKIAALTSANEAVAAAAMNAAETALLATSNGQDVRRWMNASSRMAGWAEDRPDKSKGILAKKAVDISNSAVKFVQNALAISDEALQNADVTLDAAKKAELLAQAVKKEAEGNATEAQKLR
ncbi:hypothetical protein DQ04_11661000, partial [Trypanosoma grayi]|uniref:hypothetical protein n=1 Tax=Trypanosoma grayi TaxID=71804 RepID=UPI0004F4B067